MTLPICPQPVNSKKSSSWRLIAPVALAAIFLAATITFAWPQAQAPDAAQPTAQGQVRARFQALARAERQVAAVAAASLKIPIIR